MTLCMTLNADDFVSKFEKNRPRTFRDIEVQSFGFWEPIPKATLQSTGPDL